MLPLGTIASSYFELHVYRKLLNKCFVHRVVCSLFLDLFVVAWRAAVR